MDGQSAAPGTASGELRARIEGSRGVANEVSGYKQARQTDRPADGQSDGPN